MNDLPGAIRSLKWTIVSMAVVVVLCCALFAAVLLLYVPKIVADTINNRSDALWPNHLLQIEAGVNQIMEDNISYHN